MGQAIQWAPIKVVPRWNFWIIYYEASEGSEAKSAAKVQDPVRMEISAWAWSFCGTWFGGLSAFQRQTTGGSVTTLCDLLQKSWRLPENDISSWLIFVCIHTYYIYELIIYYISYIKYYILCIIYYILYIIYYILYREGTVVAASFLTIVVKCLINHELFHWETYTKKSWITLEPLFSQMSCNFIW